MQVESGSKEELIAKIAVTENGELLEQIARLIDFESDVSGIHQMSREETAAVQEGLTQLDNGQWITNEESNNQVTEWLKKYGGL